MERKNNIFYLTLKSGTSIPKYLLDVSDCGGSFTTAEKMEEFMRSFLLIKTRKIIVYDKNVQRDYGISFDFFDEKSGYLKDKTFTYKRSFIDNYFHMTPNRPNTKKDFLI